MDNNIADQESLHLSDIMICDWSGAALDHAFGLHKPVLFIDVPRKINNPNYFDIDIEPFEVGVRHEIGEVIDMNATSETAQVKKRLVSKSFRGEYDFSEICEVYNVSNSGKIGALRLLELLDD